MAITAGALLLQAVEFFVIDQLRKRFGHAHEAGQSRGRKLQVSGCGFQIARSK